MLHLLILLIALASSSKAAAQVNVTPDLDYIPRVDYAHGKDRLDIFAPAGATNAPVVLMFHGGGLTGGDRKDETRSARRWRRAIPLGDILRPSSAATADT
jgi:acetyl esterase/lipase